MTAIDRGKDEKSPEEKLIIPISKFKSRKSDAEKVPNISIIAADENSAEHRVISIKNL